MSCFNNPDSRAPQEPWNQSPTPLANADAQPEREQLRLLILGSPDGVRSTIRILQVLNYIDQSRWSQLIPIPEPGILITPKQGEVMSYLLRYWRLS